MFNFREFRERFVIPPQEAIITKKISEQSGALIRMSRAIDELGFSIVEERLFDLRMGQRLATKIAGTLPKNHRDRPILDQVSKTFRQKADGFIEEHKKAGLSFSPTLVDRTANMVTAAYVDASGSGDNKGLKKIRNCVQAIKRTL